MTKGYIKFKNFMAIFFVIFAIIFAVMNLAIYKKGMNFANEHNAAKVEIGYCEFEPSVEFGSFIYPYPSFFKYFDEDGNDLIVRDSLFIEYDNMNQITYNWYESFKVFTVLVSILGTALFIHCLLKRIEGYGFLLMSIISLSLFFYTSYMLDVLAIVYSLTFLLSAYLVYRTKYIDYNKKFTFKK